MLSESFNGIDDIYILKNRFMVLLKQNKYLFHKNIDNVFYRIYNQKCKNKKV